jgi:glycosyltransferase involved in cell wall biosynthesis
VPVEQLPLAAPWLYQAWLRLGHPNVERATGRVDVTHATSIIPAPTRAPLVVTVHDLAFLHDRSQFTRNGVSVFTRSLELVRRRAALVLCSSTATMDDCARSGIDAARLRHVPLGVDPAPADDASVARVRALLRLPERYLLFLGTLEPRKNLRRLVDAIGLLPADERLPLVVGGAPGWGEVEAGLRDARVDVRFLGFVDPVDLPGLYAGAEVFCYPSEREGYGLPVLEAMAQGTPVVTSRATATEETAGSAGVLVDPFDVADIARGIVEARRRAGELAVAGRAHAATRSWVAVAALTAAAYREVAA